MSKKVIGITVIAGLDLAFIVLMQAGWYPAEVSQNIEPPNRYQQTLTQKQSLPELSEPVEPETINDSDEPEQTAATYSTTQNQRSFSVQNAAHVKKQRRARARTTKRENVTAKFADTVIYVKRSEPFQFQQVSLVEPELPAAEPVMEIRPEPKKKSFFSRAAPIVKKPYEWIKDLAAKLK